MSIFKVLTQMIVVLTYYELTYFRPELEES